MAYAETSRVALIRRKVVQERTGLARSTLYKLISTGDFPAPVKITGKAVAWPSDSIDEWISSRIQASSTH